MNIRILAIAMLAVAATGCSNDVLESTDRVSMKVEDRRDTGRRFWVTLVDQDTGLRIERMRLSGKRCRRGPTTFRRGETITVAFDNYRDEKTGERSRYLDKNDLSSRFC